MTFIEYLISLGFEDAVDVIKRQGFGTLVDLTEGYEEQCEICGETPEYN